MPTPQAVLDDLKSLGSETYRKTYARHGIPLDRTYGVSNAHLKTLAKSITKALKKEPGELQALALALYDTGNMDAMYLAGILADGAVMSRRELQRWAENSHAMSIVAEHTVPWVAVESPHARHMATEWINSKRDFIASSGWCTWSGVIATTPDSALDLAEIERLLTVVEKKILTVEGRHRYTMNGFVIAVGGYVMPLADKAKATAARIGEVSVEMGDTACKVPLATAYIEKMESSGRQGQKKKTIRC
ncbi:3-methyladenine DNA glycosylase AlkD [Granulicella aggregans]|uniref:3-methyladenine DNA glycosylase AlkD n=1 Tax=Granulicella aggregans TaxID=474949 RepID=A0A7W7ZGJ4_9BACT|nr:DNA alkylation repair protein [Granulicella aggregans]MBB5059467.1 3-methyladenine DNA glycosylase AlkD [Granulicella aggregans]